jgi:hypothetical protein
MERRLDAELGPLLEVVLRRRIFWTLGNATRERYVRERLGLDPSWSRALLRIELAAQTSPAFARAYRAGRLTALQAATLVPLVVADLGERWSAAWVERAGRFTLRRLRDDVERAILDAEVARLLRAVLCSVRRRMERQTGRLPTQGEALGAMLDHALRAWGDPDENLRKSHAIFARDGWRCVVPGCTSMRNLHDHHIAFRSVGGSNDASNRVTMCAFHHLRGVLVALDALAQVAQALLEVAPQREHLLPHANDDGDPGEIDVELADELVGDAHALQHPLGVLAVRPLRSVGLDDLLALERDEEALVDPKQLRDLASRVGAHLGLLSFARTSSPA